MSRSTLITMFSQITKAGSPMAPSTEIKEDKKIWFGVK